MCQSAGVFVIIYCSVAATLFQVANAHSIVNSIQIRYRRQDPWAEAQKSNANAGSNNPLNIGATSSGGVQIPFLSALTGGVLSGDFSGYRSGGANIWDGTAGGGEGVNIGGIGVSSGKVVNFPGIRSWINLASALQSNPTQAPVPQSNSTFNNDQSKLI
uniref:Uncharacterized protein n=1 Tax=Plectus sambesii TaxID=2011161 RepID=A0A914XDL6_9BILA